eukprot:ctg_5010.g468
MGILVAWGASRHLLTPEKCFVWGVTRPWAPVPYPGEGATGKTNARSDIFMTCAFGETPASSAACRLALAAWHESEHFSAASRDGFHRLHVPPAFGSARARL